MRRDCMFIHLCLSVVRGRGTFGSRALSGAGLCFHMAKAVLSPHETCAFKVRKHRFCFVTCRVLINSGMQGELKARAFVFPIVRLPFVIFRLSHFKSLRMAVKSR